MDMLAHGKHDQCRHLQPAGREESTGKVVAPVRPNCSELHNRRGMARLTMAHLTEHQEGHQPRAHLVTHSEPDPSPSRSH